MARALTLLEAALERCPDHPALLRGLAGLHFRAGHLEEAQELAARVVRIDPESADGWELLGVTRDLQDDVTGALRAWEPTGRPRVRTLEVRVLSHDGRERRSGGTDPGGITGLREGGALTVDGLVRGERRLGALPAATRARLGYRALPGGLATVEGTVVLGAGNAFTRPGLAAQAFRLLGRGIRIESMDRLGHLERWELSGGMEGSLREARAALSHPAPGALGVWRWEVAHQAGRYGPAGVTREVEGGAETTLPAGPVVRVGSTGLSWRQDHWITAAFRGSARSRVEFRGTEGTFAGGGLGWVEVLRPMGSVGPVEAGVALFADGLRALGGDPPSGAPDARRGEVHVGAGVRAGIPWVEGWLRVDWGIDPADGASTFSAAWVRPHPLTALRAH